MMTIGGLRRLIQELPDNTPVLVPGPTHDYHPVDAKVRTVMRGDRVWSEDHGQEFTPEGAEYGKRVRALIIH
jgi:hypothetical protein